MKFQITVMLTVEYEPRPADYPSLDPREMLEVDIANYRDEPQLIFLGDPDDVHVSVVGEVLED